jgi:phage shock protein B
MDWSLVEIFSTPAMLLVIVVLPLWLVFHYVTKWKALKQTGQIDGQTLGSLWNNAQKLEDRVKALETILDAEAPGWRNKQ